MPLIELIVNHCDSALNDIAYKRMQRCQFHQKMIDFE